MSEPAVVVVAMDTTGGDDNNGGGVDIPSQLARIIGADNGGRGVPRRAVVTSCGRVAEKLDVKAPNGGVVQEICVLSEVCAVVRRSKGLPVFPRTTAELAKMCLRTNMEDAWRALFNDTKTGDIDWATAIGTLFASSGACALANCLLTASNSTHLLYIAQCIIPLADHATPEQAQPFATALAARAPKELLETMAKHSIRRETRETILKCIGNLLSKVDMPTQPMADAMVNVLQSYGTRTELVTLFRNLPMERFLDHRPEIMDLLLTRCSKVAPSGRYPLLAVLAHMVSNVPSTAASADRQAALANIVVTTLDTVCKTRTTSTLDTRTMYACSILGGMIVDPAPVTQRLFNLMCQVSFISLGTLLRLQQQQK